MLSNMETALGLTVIGPSGQSLRIQRSNPVFASSKALLNTAAPAEQIWLQLQTLLANPLQALVSWCARFGLRLEDRGDSLRIQDTELGRAEWLPLLQRTHAAGGSPKPLVRLAAKLGASAGRMDVSKLCLHWQERPGRDPEVGIVKLAGLPMDAKVGDLVLPGATGPNACLVSYDQFAGDETVGFDLLRGMVIACYGKPGGADPAQDILEEPVILGFNKTYRCEEGTPDGWLEDFSFDSLKAARLNAREIQAIGSEVRIINRITGDMVAID